MMPPIPLDDGTLGLLEDALRIDEEAKSTSLYPFLDMISQLAGSDITAVAEEVDGITVLRDPQYSTHDLIRELVAEVRRLRAAGP